MKKDKKQDNKIRITIDLTPEFYTRLQNLEKILQFDTKAQVIREALRLYEFLASEWQGGTEFYRSKEKGEVEKISLFTEYDRGRTA
jgi:hypothetical protein